MYYRRIPSLEELVGEEGLLRLPQYIFDEFVIDDNRGFILEEAAERLKSGKRVILYGAAGTGKTALMAVILRRLMDEGYGIGLIIDGTYVLNRHEEEGIILFYDDIPRMNSTTLRSIITNNAGMIIATARVEEMEYLSSKLGGDPVQYFDLMELRAMSDIHLREILLRFAFREGISIEDKAIDMVVEKAQGLPVYIWQVIRDLKINMRYILDENFASRIPAGMLDYVDDILWRIMGENPERKETLLTLLIIADIPGYKVHQDLLNAIFAEAKRAIYGREYTIKQILLSDLLDRVCRYLSRTPDYSFKLPHDAWRDVLIGKSRGLMSGEISRINSAFPREERLEILRSAIRRAYDEVIQKIDDEERRKAFLEQVAYIDSSLVEHIERKEAIPQHEIQREEEKTVELVVTEKPLMFTFNKYLVAKKKKFLGLVIEEFIIMDENRNIIGRAKVSGIINRRITIFDRLGDPIGNIEFTIALVKPDAIIKNWNGEFVGKIKCSLSGKYVVEDRYGIERYSISRKDDTYFVYDSYGGPVARIIMGKKEDFLEIIGDIDNLIALSILMVANILK